MERPKAAKERLKEILEPLSEQQAERLLPLFERGKSMEVIGRAIAAELETSQGCRNA